MNMDYDCRTHNKCIEQIMSSNMFCFEEFISQQSFSIIIVNYLKVKNYQTTFLLYSVTQSVNGKLFICVHILSQYV